jgi:hypothetical protein
MDRNAPTAEVMLEVLERLGERFDGVEPYLLVPDLGQDDLDRCATELLAPEEGGSPRARDGSDGSFWQPASCCLWQRAAGVRAVGLRPHLRPRQPRPPPRDRPSWASGAGRIGARKSWRS